jgi:hypothetical protein
MICLTTADHDIVHQLHARAQWFLWDQRHRRGNAGWFTVEEIAADFGERPPLIPLLHALRDFGATGQLESDGKGRVRHA